MSSEELLVLTLAPNNPSNTIITSATGDVVYTVVTEHTKTTTTTQILNAQEEVVASSEWRDVLPDKITIGNNKPISLGDWMKRSLVPFKDDISFTDNEGRKYKWRGNSAGRDFELYTADDKYASPIARFHRPRLIHVPLSLESDPSPNDSAVSSTPTLINSKHRYPQTPATLVLSSRAVQIQDTIVTSFLFLEKSHRINETEHQSRADVLGAPDISVGVQYRATNGGVP
ncbi:hypothetical protein PHLCEN_2v10013 [Hermanssonia centrifuga]|uniref:DUF6593 domain-containing protein n=1 Tax=Hermanssonia centrifuga TaxID=98765 RepID=A0A2R6NP80_9APHY|nr:hypothetical protein PHLCEN_2v10013 [Hermanssonia centrifuga]